MLLTAWAEGVGSNWVGFGGLDKVNAVLDIPAGLDVLAILPFGYPAALLVIATMITGYLQRES